MDFEYFVPQELGCLVFGRLQSPKSSEFFHLVRCQKARILGIWYARIPEIWYSPPEKSWDFSIVHQKARTLGIWYMPHAPNARMSATKNSVLTLRHTRRPKPISDLWYVVRFPKALPVVKPAPLPFFSKGWRLPLVPSPGNWSHH